MVDFQWKICYPRRAVASWRIMSRMSNCLSLPYQREKISEAIFNQSFSWQIFAKSQNLSLFAALACALHQLQISVICYESSKRISVSSLQEVKFFHSAWFILHWTVTEIGLQSITLSFKFRHDTLFFNQYSIYFVRFTVFFEYRKTNLDIYQSHVFHLVVLVVALLLL